MFRHQPTFSGSSPRAPTAGAVARDAAGRGRRAAPRRLRLAAALAAAARSDAEPARQPRARFENRELRPPPPGDSPSEVEPRPFLVVAPAHQPDHELLGRRSAFDTASSAPPMPPMPPLRRVAISAATSAPRATRPAARVPARRSSRRGPRAWRGAGRAAPCTSRRSRARRAARRSREPISR